MSEAHLDIKVLSTHLVPKAYSFIRRLAIDSYGLTLKTPIRSFPITKVAISLREINDWEFASKPNATGLVGIFALIKTRGVVLAQQFRRPMQARVLEICAGLIGDEEEFSSESIVDCTTRELLEETGHVPEISPSSLVLPPLRA